MPLSGLHAVTGTGRTSAAYLVGLFNSTPVQDLAEALAPGSVSQDDIEQLRLPQFDATTASSIEKDTLDLADNVRDLVLSHGETWPGLPDALRFDITLSTTGQDAWAPRPKRRGWGTFGSVPWIRVRVEGATGQVQSTELSDDLFGRHLIVHFARGRVTVDVDEHADADLRVFLELLVRGRIAQAARTGQSAVSPVAIKNLPVPLTTDGLVDLHAADVAAANVAIARYRTLRERIDRTVLDALSEAAR